MYLIWLFIKKNNWQIHISLQNQQAIILYKKDASYTSNRNTSKQKKTKGFPGNFLWNVDNYWFPQKNILPSSHLALLPSLSQHSVDPTLYYWQINSHAFLPGLNGLSKNDSISSLWLYRCQMFPTKIKKKNSKVFEQKGDLLNFKANIDPRAMLSQIKLGRAETS